MYIQQETDITGLECLGCSLTEVIVGTGCGREVTANTAHSQWFSYGASHQQTLSCKLCHQSGSL